MSSNLKLRKIFYGLLLMMIAGCTPFTTSPVTETASPSTTTPAADQLTPGSNMNSLCENPLFPIKQGAAWTYINTGSPAGTFTYTDTIANVHSDGFTVTSQFGDVTYIQDWACKPEGLQLLQFGDTIAMALSTQGISADLTTSDVTGVTLPVNITPGMQWTYGFNLQGNITYEGQQAEADGTVTTTLQEAGSESVTVPAGTFNATRIETTSNFDLTASVFGFDVPVEYTTISTFWYTPGIGLVKLTETNNFEGTTFSLTSELQSFGFP